ncbi:MAG: GntR family transcriptional regulator [Euzebyales bacterium]|nr:GntR family transcriptional regulator [Euzebyales bacterium]
MDTGEPTSMVDGVYATLLSAIVDMRLGARTPLSQNKLAAHLGVSRTPVREALLRLERDGLVERIPDMGFVVATITPAEVNEACDLLELLDSYVYRRATESSNEAQLTELLALAAELVRSAEAGDTGAWQAADHRYHQIVMEAANNRFVAGYLQQVRRRVQRFWLQEPLFDGRLRTCSQDHVALAQAMIDHDEAVLAETVRAHIGRMRRNVLDRLESAGPLLPGTDPLAAVKAGHETPTRPM